MLGRVELATRLASDALVMAALALVVSGIGCRRPVTHPIPAEHPDDPTPRRGGTLELASTGEPRGGLDPAASADEVGAIPIRMLFDGLVTFDERGTIVPSIAERFEIVEDGTLYRFHLRHDVRFHDGALLVAGDIERSIERALHPSTPNGFASAYAAIVGYDDYAAGKVDRLSGVEVEGTHVVSIRLKVPDAAFLPALAMHPLRPVCRSAGNRYSDAWHPCGAGPFRLPENAGIRNNRLTIVRHDGYYRVGLPYLDAVSWLFNTTSFSQSLRFRDGELDMFRYMSGSDLPMFRDARWSPFTDEEAEDTVAGESMNTQMPPFDNVEIRRAVAAAINRDHVRLMSPGRMTTANQPLPPSVIGNSKIHNQSYDPAAALEHMRRAGYPYDPNTGRGGYPHTIQYLAYAPGLAEATAQVLQQELAKIGLRIEIKLVAWPAFLAISQRRRGTAISWQGWHLDFPDPSNVFDSLFATSAIEEDSSLNTAFYSNPELDELLRRARRTTDVHARRGLYEEATRIVCDDAPWAFTYYYHWFQIRHPYVRGYRPHAVWTDYVVHTWLDRDAAGRRRHTTMALPSVPRNILH